MIALTAMLLAGGQGMSPANHIAGRAPHWDGHPETFGFLDPSLSVSPSATTADSIADGDFTIRLRQADRNEVIRSYEVVVPGWRFSVENMPTSPLTNCGAVNSTTNTGDANHVVKKMEAVGRMGVLLHTDRTRDPNSYATPRPDAVLATDPATGPAGYGTFDSNASHRNVWFLGWRPNTAPDAAPGTGTATLCALLNDGNVRAPSDGRLLLVQILLERLPDASWKIKWDFMPATGDDANGDGIGDRSILDKSSFQNGNVSILDIDMTLFRLTVGNFNDCGATCPNPCPDPKNFATCKAKPLVFSRTPANPGNYVATGTFTPCSTATDTPPLPCNSNVATATRTQTIKVTPAPSPFVRDFGRLTGPSGPGTMPAGFALVQGQTSVTFTWDQPAVVHPEFPVKGYVLAVAVPHVQSTLHYEYLITNKSYVPGPGVAGFDSREPCGADGLSPACSLTLSFPLDTVGGSKLQPNGKYAVALITVYTDEARTDGLCDDGTPQGVECPATQPPISVVQYSSFKDWWVNGGRHGVSGIEFMMLPKQWPNVYLQGATIPSSLLLVDYASTPKDAAFVLWKAHEPTFGTFPGTGQVGIQGQDQSGVVSFGLHIGTDQHYRFDGAIQGASAQGRFVQYSMRQVGSRLTTVPSLDPSRLPDPLQANTQPCAVIAVTCVEFSGTRL